MMVFLHEMRQNAKMLAVWSVVIGGMVVLCVAMFPDISAQSEDFTAMFSSLGVFTEAFGMDQLSIGEPLGFFGVECGAVLGIGGAFFAAYLGAVSYTHLRRRRTSCWWAPSRRRRLV